MIAVTPEVQAVLDSGAAFYADLYTFTLVSGDVIRITSSDMDILWGGQLWASPAQSGAPLIERGDITFEIGLTVDQLELTVHAGLDHLVLGLPWPHALRVGLFDGADVELVRAVAKIGEPIAGVIPRFAGKVGPVEPGRVASTITVDSMLAYMRAPVPRNVYQPGCANTVYDPACGVSRTANETTVTVTSISADGIEVGISGAALLNSRYQGGFARFIGGGSNAGQQVTVFDNAVGSLTLLYPFPAAVHVGDTLAIAPGCDKSMTGCAGFGGDWKNRFRGHPHVPKPETML